MSLLDWKRRKDNLNGNHPMRVGATSFFCHNFEVRDSHLALSFLELRFSLRQVIEFPSIASSSSSSDLLGWKSGASCLAMTTAKSATSRAWTAATSASSALPRAVDVREMAMSAFCKAILEALCAALTAASIRSRNLADRIKNRCFFFCDVISTLFLYLPSSFVPSCVQQSENHER